MAISLVECVPNFSEAARPEVVQAILQAMQDVAGVNILDYHSDLSHNRTVVTFVGSPQAVEEAAFQGIAKAAALIDLNQHVGEHPRIGATDVVPFIPIAGVSMQDCIEIAHRLGQRVGDELGIPVYLYEQAASRPERQNLENIRRGEYEILKKEIVTQPERAPDFGPAQLGPAGATVIGARPFLVAYNVYLNSADVSIADKIAKAIRHSSGGMCFVKALGLLVDGRAQVSMNLTDFHKTPVARVVEIIRREAARYGVTIHHSELVGLIPEAALVDAAVWYLQLDQFDPQQILERKLDQLTRDQGLVTGEKQWVVSSQGQAPIDQAPLPASKSSVTSHFLDALASDKPTPGGGSASAYTGAMAAALVAMVARVTLGKKKYSAVEAHMQAILEKAEAIRTELETAVEQDAAAFDQVMLAYKLPKNTPTEIATRLQAIEVATLQAARVPLEVAQKAVTILELAVQVITHGNINAISDAGSAAALARAALVGAGLNVRINVASLQDQSQAMELINRLQALEDLANESEEIIRQQIVTRGGLKF